jgi:hypothetical protein
MKVNSYYLGSGVIHTPHNGVRRLGRVISHAGFGPRGYEKRS